MQYVKPSPEGAPETPVDDFLHGQQADADFSERKNAPLVNMESLFHESTEELTESCWEKLKGVRDQTLLRVLYE